MKLKQWLYGAAALAMLAACSDKDIAPNNGDDLLSEDGSPISGYLAVEIKLPQEVISRAEDEGAKNDNFADGLESEYTVKNAMIVVFKGTNEKAATFQKAVNLTKPFFTNTPDDDNITSSYVAAIPVDKLSTTGNEHYYGLVILNRNPASTNVGNDKDGHDTGVKIANRTLVKGTTTLTDILKYETTTEFIGENGFFMTNAPLADKSVSATSSAADIHYLADLGNQTWNTIDEAKKNISSCVYVERAVAKVTGKNNDTNYILTFVDQNGNNVAGLNVTATVKYALTNTNQKSYVVRNVESDLLGGHFFWNLAHSVNNRLRMIGSTPMPGLDTPFHSGAEGTKPSTNWFRTYWCHDPNYDKDAFTEVEDGPNTTEFKVVTATTDFKSLNTPLYCKENTFDVAHMNNGNSTMVVFEVNYTVIKPATAEGANDAVNYNDLYIKDGDNTKIYTSEDDVLWAEKSRVINDKDIQTALTDALTKSGAQNFADENGVVKNAEKYITLNTEKNENSELIVKSISITPESGITNAGITAFNTAIGTPTGKNEDGQVVGSQIHQKLLANVNALSDITMYEGGVCYYMIPVKHFGDYYCPWTETLGTDTKTVYNGGKAFGADDNHAKDYLGRYGMVRNNWYELNLSEIKGLGEPQIPEINLTLSDDNKEDKRYIGVEIHVLSWAKRIQNVKF